MSEKLKTTVAIILAFIIAGNVTSSIAQSNEQSIAVMRKNFTTINADKTLTKKTLSGEAFLDEAADGGAEVTGYFKESKLVKMVEWIGLSFGNRSREFYLDDKGLFFVYEKFESFVIVDSTGEMDHSRVKKTFEGRYYFRDGKLIQQKQNGQRLMEEEHHDISKELKESAKKDCELLKKGH